MGQWETVILVIDKVIDSIVTYVNWEQLHRLVILSIVTWGNNELLYWLYIMSLSLL